MSALEIKNKYTYPLGHVFHTEDGHAYTVKGFLGRGGQGEVYRVSGSDGEYAIKWYYADSYLRRIDADAFYKNLSHNVAQGVPSLSSGDAATQFVWPLKMVKRKDRSFGYMMRLFPEGYEPLRNVLTLRRRDKDTGLYQDLHWKSWFVCLTAALNIVRAFEILHASGLSYQDLNEGGIIVNMQNGNVMICDCDNVSSDKSNLGIRGIMTYMAPEVILGKSLPDRRSDEYSLAVVLFRLLLHGHPMHGTESFNLHNDARVTQQQADLKIYGSAPHYCLASTNNQNPPDPKRNRDVGRLSFLFPLVLMDAFEQVFTVGVNDPVQRLTATEWRRVLLQARDQLVMVNGGEQFFGVRRPKPLPAACRTLVYPHGMRVLCMPDKILYRYHLDEYSADFKTPVAKVIPTKKPDVIGLYNGAGAAIQFSDGSRWGTCPNKGRIPLLKGMLLKLGTVTVTVE